MTQPQYRTLLAFARTLLDNHPDQTLEPGDLVAEAYLKHGDDVGKMRKFMVGLARTTRVHTQRWLGYLPKTKNFPIETSQICKHCQRELPFEDYQKVDLGLGVFYQQTCKKCDKNRVKARLADQIKQAATGKFNQTYAPPPTHKTCKVCGVDKPINKFKKQYWGMRLYYNNRCLQCAAAQSREYRRRKAERLKKQPPQSDQ